MPSKADKKREAKIVKALTHACEKIKGQVDGFVWLTHSVNYQQFPQSLLITCVFDSTEQQANALQSSDLDAILDLIGKHLARIDVNLTSLDQHILFDNEQACSEEHNSDWQRRLGAH